MRRLMLLFAVCGMMVLTVRPGYSSPDSTEPGPAQDGTLKALSAIAGQGIMDSHAFDYLTN